MEFLFLAISWLLISNINYQPISVCEASGGPTDDHKYPYPFMTTDAQKAVSRSYDYIIVGGGAAGCPLAATLSEKYSVLLIERGGSPYGNPDIENATLFGKPLGQTDKYTSIAQAFLTEDGVQLHRARVLGGGTAINAGFYSRGSLDYIRKMGWDEKLVNQSFEWVESHVAFKPNRLSVWNSAVKNALVNAGVLPDNGYTVNHMLGTKISDSTFDNNGKRHTAADHLKVANPQNIVVLLNASVNKILIDSLWGKLKAHGVDFTSTVDGKRYEVFTKTWSFHTEVIVSAGSLGSPQLLLLSGIGPSEHLKKFNITVLLDSPSVGEGVQDNPAAFLTIQSPKPLETASIQVVAIINNSQAYIESSSSSKGAAGNVFTKVAFPLSRGVLRLTSRDPRDNPSVRYNYYKHPQDLQTCMEGAKVMAKLFRTDSMHHFAYNGKFKFVGKPLPNNTRDDAVMTKFCRDTFGSMWHFHGGCHIGSVIDHEYKVKGVCGLRIVDGSTFKEGGPGTNPQATTMMLGRYVGMKILGERCASTAMDDNKWNISTFTDSQSGDIGDL